MPQLPDLEAWAIFAKVAEAGSFAGAAAELDLSKATVSKAVSRLEGRLGERLFHRTSRRLSLTETGRVLSVRAAQILADAEAVEAEALAQSATPRGRIRMAAPMSFGVEHVAPALPDFFRAYPEISIDLHLSDQTSSWSAAVSIWRCASPRSRIRAWWPGVSVRCGACWSARLIISPAAGGRRIRETSQRMPVSAIPICPRATIGNSSAPAGEEHEIAVTGPLRANNADALMPALRAGLGVAVQPEFVVWRDLRAGRLEAVMSDWSAPPIALNIVMPPGGPRPPKVAALIEFLVRRFSERAAPWAQP